MWVKALVCVLSHLLIAMSPGAAQFRRCYDTGNFTTNSTYGINRDLILGSLPANVSANGGFFTATIGQEPNKVYALGLCKGDSSSENCSSSLNSTIRDLIASCPNQKGAFSWGGDPPSLVHYADRSFIGILELEPTNLFTNVNDITWNLTEFDLVWESLMDRVVRKASMGSSRLKYATGEANFATFQTIYALMQCTPDLSQKDCDTCLRKCVSNYQRCCHGKQGGAVQKPSCWFRWDLFPFYVSSPATTAPSLSPPPPPGSPPPPHWVNSTSTKESGGVSSQTLIIIVVPIVIFLAVVIIAVAVLLKRRTKTKQDDKTRDEITGAESLQFDFDAVLLATNNFSDANKLGQGGFGAVYKGQLPNGQEVAVKRLSMDSGPGDLEFKNKVLLLAKLQHRNLVRLLGFCLEGKEKHLIFEFVPNASLDHFIFDPNKRSLLDWERHYKIIEGIARGLLYLHEDSRLQIIHHDLKASNILLDADMIPKIADFGMARLFRQYETQGSTSRIVGTYGYMAPEYVIHGRFSVKSDVFSFGVLILEIVSGQKSNCVRHGESDEYLLNFVWRNWREGTALNIIDPTLSDGSRNEMMRCIHIGLLCVQENVAGRPTMASVVLMLNSFSTSLAVPSQPAFASLSNMESDGLSSLGTDSLPSASAQSRNGVSIIELSGR